MAQMYDVYYRVHTETYGWLDWAKNGEIAGTTGCAKRLECIQVVLVKKVRRHQVILKNACDQIKSYYEKEAESCIRK